MRWALTGYIAIRLARAFATVIGIVTLVFLLVHLIPGDPIDAILGDQASPEDRAHMRSVLRLDRSISEQYWLFLGDISNGTLGYSFRSRTEQVSDLILTVLPHTVVLALASIFVAWLLAIPLGVIAALNRATRWDKSTSLVAMLGIAIPNIWLGPLLILLFGVQLRWLPLPGDDPTEMEALILPAITLGTALTAILARQTRASMVEVMGEQYIIAAYARGLSTTKVVFKHALRNALIPVLTVGTAQLGAVLSGAVVTEKIFERPGLGTLFLEAFFARDIPVVQGCVLIIALFYVLVNLLVDLLYTAVDPRIRFVQ